MYVVYPKTISIVQRNDAISAHKCIEIGFLFGIPDTQLPIEKKFQFGHAEHPD